MEDLFYAWSTVISARERERTLNLMYFNQPRFVNVCVEGGGLGVVYRFVFKEYSGPSDSHASVFD